MCGGAGDVPRVFAGGARTDAVRVLREGIVRAVYAAMRTMPGHLLHLLFDLQVSERVGEGGGMGGVDRGG